MAPKGTKRAGVLDTFGIELEFHVSDGNGKSIDTIGLGDRLNGQVSAFGEIDSDAGLGLAEGISKPFPSVRQAAEAIKQIVGALPVGWRKDFVVYRPQDLGPAQWANKPRYEALKQAAAIEQPERWHLINNMTGIASTHVNMSGKGFDPLDPEGQLVMNVFRNAGPHIAAAIHKQLGYGHGHLSMWNFADRRRMPDFHRWHPNFPSFNAEFAGKPRFVGETERGSGVWQALPTGFCSVYDDIDLGTFWDYVRPKKIPGTRHSHYLEVRLLPSMHPDLIFTYADMIVSMTELIIGWHRTKEGSRELSREEAAPVFAHVERHWKGMFPKEPLEEATWNRLLLE